MGDERAVARVDEASPWQVVVHADPARLQAGSSISKVVWSGLRRRLTLCSRSSTVRTTFLAGAGRVASSASGTPQASGESSRALPLSADGIGELSSSLEPVGDAAPAAVGSAEVELARASSSPLRSPELARLPAARRSAACAAAARTSSRPNMSSAS